MKPSVRLFLALPLLISASTAAMAAATPEEAERLTKVFQSYVGTSGDLVKVVPEGDGYNVTLDVKIVTDAAASKGDTFSMTPISFTLTDKSGGKWDVQYDGPFELSGKSKDGTEINMKMESYEWQGEFDEKLAYFTSGEGTVKNTTLDEKIVDPEKGLTSVSVQIKEISIEQKGTANAEGGVDGEATYHLEGLTETIASPASAATNVPAMNLAIAAESGDYEAKMTGGRTQSILDILAFAVAHPDKDLMQKDQSAFKDVINAAIPLFQNMQGSSVFKTVSVTTPIGVVAFDEMNVSADMNGIVKDGKFTESIEMKGLSLPAGIVPPWATTLVPKDMTFDFTVSDFDLAGPAGIAMAALDLTKEPPLSDEVGAMAMSGLLPKGTATIALNPTSISNDVYSVTAEGTMTAGPATPIPSGKGVVKAKGLDEIMKVIQSAPPEAGLQSGAAMVIAAKGMGKAEADGTITWNIESAGDGKVLVNGIDLSQMK